MQTQTWTGTHTIQVCPPPLARPFTTFRDKVLLIQSRDFRPTYTRRENGFCSLLLVPQLRVVVMKCKEKDRLECLKWSTGCARSVLLSLLLYPNLY